MKKTTLTAGWLMTLLVTIAIASCSSSNDFKKGKTQLEQMGYTNVENTGHEFFCCSKDDSYSTGFRCQDKSGKWVTGCICSSNFKGITLRFN